MSNLQWKPRAGDWVEVRPAAEILRTLDRLGDFERMPFMPEMLKYAGRRFKVLAVAHKTCDTVDRTGGRSVRDAVHLSDLRCDGYSHGGCQAACLLFWKTAWLRPVDGPAGIGMANQLESIETATLDPYTSSINASGVRIFRCQATTLPEWSQPLPWWDARQYLRDVQTGNVPLRVALRVLFLAGLRRLLHMPYGTRVWVGLLNFFHQLLMQRPPPFARGIIPNGQPTPDLRTNLRPGERVRLKSHEEILATVNFANKNRGLSFDPEMSVYCRDEFRVAARVERIINEKTGEMMELKNPCIRLDGAVCNAWYSRNRHLCPRRITSYFREIWLERAGDNLP